MRGMALVNAATLVAELGDPSRFGKPRQLMVYRGLEPSVHSGGASVRRGGLYVPIPGAAQPRVAASAGSAVRPHPRDRLAGTAAAVRAIARSPAAASQPISSLPRSPVGWLPLFGTSQRRTAPQSILPNGFAAPHRSPFCQTDLPHRTAVRFPNGFAAPATSHSRSHLHRDVTDAIGLSRHCHTGEGRLFPRMGRLKAGPRRASGR
jgi:hypothetical protein